MEHMLVLVTAKFNVCIQTYPMLICVMYKGIKELVREMFILSVLRREGILDHYFHLGLLIAS